jgi:hypothetical protein
MDRVNGTAELNESALKDSFAVVSTLIAKEWPAVEQEALAATAGDAGRVVDLVAERTQHTKTLVRRQLAELVREAAERSEPGILMAQAKAVLDRLEKKTAELSSYVRDTVAPQAHKKVQENLLMSLLCALGVGVLLGFVLRSLGRGR